MYTEVSWIVIKSDISLKYLTLETSVEILSIGSNICLLAQVTIYETSVKLLYISFSLTLEMVCACRCKTFQAPLLAEVKAS